jgi:hypothetical protein
MWQVASLLVDIGLVASQGYFIPMKLDFVVENMYSLNTFAIPTNGIWSV